MAYPGFYSGGGSRGGGQAGGSEGQKSPSRVQRQNSTGGLKKCENYSV